MTTSIRSCGALAILLLLVAIPPAFTQDIDTRPVRTQAAKPVLERFRGEVLFMTRISITVRHRENINLVRTFSFDEKLAPKMATLVDTDRAFQHGDRVEIFFHPGSDVAVRVKGKPSRPRGGLQ